MMNPEASFLTDTANVLLEVLETAVLPGTLGIRGTDLRMKWDMVKDMGNKDGERQELVVQKTDRIWENTVCRGQGWV